MEFSLGLRSNKEAESVMQGWVQEMWGYSIAAASVGVSHRLVREMQIEASSLTQHVDPDFHQVRRPHTPDGARWAQRSQSIGIR